MNRVIDILFVDLVDKASNVNGVLESLSATHSSRDCVCRVVLLLAIVVHLLFASVVGGSLVAQVLARKLGVAVGGLGP